MIDGYPRALTLVVMAVAAAVVLSLGLRAG
jgi:hypothetical protein